MREEKGTTEGEVVGWHHRLDGHEFEQAPGVGDGQGGLACCSPRGRKESETTERLKWYPSFIVINNITGHHLVGPVIEKLPAIMGDTDSVPGLGRSHVLRSNQARVPSAEKQPSPYPPAAEASLYLLGATTRKASEMRSLYITARE